MEGDLQAEVVKRISTFCPCREILVEQSLAAVFKQGVVFRMQFQDVQDLLFEGRER